MRCMVPHTINLLAIILKTSLLQLYLKDQHCFEDLLHSLPKNALTAQSRSSSKPYEHWYGNQNSKYRRQLSIAFAVRLRRTPPPLAPNNHSALSTPRAPLAAPKTHKNSHNWASTQRIGGRMDHHGPWLECPRPAPHDELWPAVPAGEGGELPNKT